MLYAMCFGHCISCKRPFTFNPLRVPSVRVNGEREPVCRRCIEIANVKRKEMGIDPIVIKPDAYEGADANELDFGD